MPDHAARVQAGTADAAKATVAARCAPANVTGFQDAYVDAVIACKVVGGRQT
jgi:hypothetical protein